MGMFDDLIGGKEQEESMEYQVHEYALKDILKKMGEAREVVRVDWSPGRKVLTVKVKA